MNFRSFILKITDRWHIKILSVAAALILSIFYRLNSLDTRVYTLPIKVEQSATLITLDPTSHSVRLTIRGESNSILSITEDDFETYIDLTRYSKEGTYRVPVKIRKKGNALGVDPLEISVSPAELHLTLEENVTRSIKVYPVFSGSVAEGYELIEQTLTPDSITAEGPKSILDSLREFITEPVELAGRSESFTAIVPIKNNNPNIVIYGDRIIEYSCTIKEVDRTPVVYFVVPNPNLNNYINNIENDQNNIDDASADTEDNQIENGGYAE